MMEIICYEIEWDGVGSGGSEFAYMPTLENTNPLLFKKINKFKKRSVIEILVNYGDCQNYSMLQSINLLDVKLVIVPKHSEKNYSA